MTFLERAAHFVVAGQAWVRTVPGGVALWWKNPRRQQTLAYTGTRPGDVAALGGNHPGYTWHHCRNYNAASNSGTMQQVPTAEHGNWGHLGGAEQAGY
jgi:hypothetical protein